MSNTTKCSTKSPLLPPECSVTCENLSAVWGMRGYPNSSCYPGQPHRSGCPSPGLTGGDLCEVTEALSPGAADREAPGKVLDWGPDKERESIQGRMAQKENQQQGPGAVPLRRTVLPAKELPVPGGSDPFVCKHLPCFPYSLLLPCAGKG